MNNENTRAELLTKTTKELKEMAQEKGIDTKGKKKDDFVDALIDEQCKPVDNIPEEGQPLEAVQMSLGEKSEVIQSNENTAADENIQLPDVPEAEQSTIEQNAETSFSKDIITTIELEKLDPSPLNFFRPLKPKKYIEVKESIKALGLLQPIIVRTKEDGRYEILAGHNRVTICKDLGFKEISAIIKNVSDDDAEEIIADTNVAQRDDMSPLELAKAYEIKARAIGNRRGQRTDLNGGERFSVREMIGKEFEVSGRKVDRYLKLNNLRPEFKELLENEKIKIAAAFELGAMDEDTQKAIIKNINITKDTDIAKINTKSVAEIKKALKKKNDLPLDDKKELIKNGKEIKQQSLTKDDVKSIFKQANEQKPIVLKLNVPEETDEDIISLVKDSPEIVMELLEKYVAGVIRL